MRHTRLVSMACLAACCLQLFAQSWEEWKDPTLNEVNRAPMHTGYFAYENEATALAGCPENSIHYLSLNGLWKFNWVEDADCRPTDFFRTDFNDKGWGQMPVPGIWEHNGFGDPLYLNIGYAWSNQAEVNPPVIPVKGNHVGSYRRTIELPAHWNGRQIMAHFGSVTSNIYLWVNGKFVGYSEDSKLEAEFDLTRYLHPGENLIAFQVFRWCDGSYLEDQDFFRLSGVARDCYLYTRDKGARIQDIRVTPLLDPTYTDGSLSIILDRVGKGEVQLRLLDANSECVAEKTVPAGQKEAVLSVENPFKWSAETPYLYTLVATLTSGGKVVESIPVKVGFRSVEIRNAQLLVNGQPIYIKGANRHEMDPDGGYVLSRERMLQDIRIMKEMNINAVRTCHYPDDPLWYDLCDEYGIYMVAEANIESHGMGYGEKTLAIREDYALAHLQRNQRNVRRSVNHPAVIIWSLGNEAGFGPNFEACYRWIRSFDPSRPIQYERATKEEFSDIFCPMYCDYRRMESYANDPAAKRPLIQCEYAHAMGNSEGGFKEYWDLFRKYPKLQGGFIWDFVDQSQRAFDERGRMFYGYGGDWNPYDASDQNFCDNGLISPDRVWNPHAYEVQYYYQNIWPTLKDMEKGTVEVFNEYFFKCLCNYRMEWTLLSNGEPIQSGTINELKVKPQQRAEYLLGYDLTGVCPEAELALDLHFVLKNRDGLLPAGFIAAKEQILLREKSTCDKEFSNSLAANEKLSVPQVSENDRHFLMIDGEDFHLEFNRSTGFLTRWQFAGREMLYRGTSLRPNFWRSPTDNDFGARLQQRFAAWKSPEMNLKELKTSTESGLVVVIASYDMPSVKGELTLTYTLNNKGVLQVKEQFKALGEGVSEMFRFGMTLQVPDNLEIIDYYGRGPVENYADRKGCAFLGIYHQSVDEQFYPYIRPQETGTKSDVRWWKLSGLSGNGLTFTAPKPFSISALHYSQESLDDGAAKHQSHSHTVDKVPYVNINIDLVQMGLGCVTSWGAWPLPQYRIPYKDYEFIFVIRPERG